MAEQTRTRELEQVQSGASATEDKGSHLVGSAAPPRADEPAPSAVVAENHRMQRGRLNRLQAATQLVIATAVVLVGIYYAKLPLVVVFVSILLAFILAPVVDALERLRVPRSVASLLATILFLALLYVTVWAGYNSAQNFLSDLPRYSGEIRRAVVHFREKAEEIQKTTEGAINGNAGHNNKKEAVQLPTISALVASNFGSVTEMVFIISFIPFLIYFMLSWQEHARTATVKLFRMENRSTAYVTVGLMSSMIRSFIVGNVIVGLFMAGVSTLVFGLIGLPYFYFLGVLSGFLSLVPYLGVVLAVVPPVAAGLGHVHSTQFIIIVVTVFGLHLFALNVLYPKFLGSRLQLNPLAVTLALLFWGWLWGAMGLILAIPITGAMKIIFDHIDGLRPYGEWLGE